MSGITEGATTTSTKFFKATAAYTYYTDGSLKTDNGKGITAIKYDYNRLPVEVTIGTKTMKYMYTAGGNKVQINDGDGKIYDYIGGVVYLNNQIEYVGTAAGRWLPKEQLKAYNANKTVAGAAKFGRYEYQLKDHLGNLRVACRCLEKGEVAEASRTPNDAYAPVVVQEQQYDPWGLDIGPEVQPFTSPIGISGLPDRFKFLGREEQAETGWVDLMKRMYDPPTARFISVDPSPDVEGQESLTPYQYGWNNPLRYPDPNGDCPLCGLVIGAGVDYAFQVATNYANGQSLANSFTHEIDLKSIAISTVTGAATSGLSAIGGKSTQFAISTAIDATESVAKQINTGGVNSVTFSQTASDVVSNKVAGFLTKKAENIIDTKVLGKEADRTARVSANDPSSAGRATRAETAQGNLNKAEKVNKIVGQTASGVVGNTIQNTSNVVRTPSGNSSYIPTVGVAKSDATNVQRPITLIRPNQ